MDFRQTTQTAGSRPNPANPAPAASEHKVEKTAKVTEPHGRHWMQMMQLIVLVGIAILLLGIALVFTRGNDGNEAKYIEKAKYQAVFLANGQVYFGKVSSLTGKYIYLNDVYYLTQNNADASAANAASSSSYSLTQLGKCQIHDPSGQMVINRDQVTFWENLQSNGKVVTSINQLKKQFPNGQECSSANTQPQASNSSSQSSQNSSNAGTGTNSANK